MQATLPKSKRDAAEWDRCKADIAYWISTYCWTFDPRPEDPSKRHVRFVLYPYQIDYLNWLEERYRTHEDGLTEKSRDMGATWIQLAWDIHHWLFDEGFQSLWGSRKEDLVDNHKLDSLFGRFEYLLDHLPDWMMPAGWDKRKCRTFMSIVNPENGNALIGESANPDFSRQGRYSVIHLDEYAFWAWGESVWTATADSSTTRFPMSTPNGSNMFKHLRFSGRIKVQTLHWRLHPKKDQTWYEAEKGRRTDEDIARELDISYDKSVRGRVYPEWDQVRKGVYPFTQGWPLYVSWDFGLDDNTALIWWQRNPTTGQWRVVDCYEQSGKTIDYYVPFVSGQLPSGLPYSYSQADIAKVESHSGWGSSVHFGDPAGKQRNQVTGTSVIDELRKAGIHVQTRPDVNTFEARWQTTKLFLRRIEGVNEQTCIALHDAVTNARFPDRPESSQSTNEISKPIHDWSSHFRTALEYMAVNEPVLHAEPARLTVPFRMGGR